MNTSTDTDAVFQYHRYMLQLHGSQSILAQGWRDLHSQVVRFGALAGLTNFNNRSVLDAGCGYADLFPFLHQRYPEITYYGVEQIPELLDEARHRYRNWPQVSFISGNFISDPLPVTDYVVACGSLNYHNNDPDFIFKAITKLYAQCKLGFAFNLLSHVIPNGLIVAYNPEKIMDYCFSLSKQVTLKNDYSDEDFTVLIQR